MIWVSGTSSMRARNVTPSAWARPEAAISAAKLAAVRTELSFNMFPLLLLFHRAKGEALDDESLDEA